MTEDRSALCLRAEGVHKSFGVTRALSGVALSVRAGEVHALLGENGAGKSTLLKILAGSLAPDAGVIELGGQRYLPKNPQQAQALGVAFVSQEPALCPDLSVAENILLNELPGRFGLVDRRAQEERAGAALAQVLPEGAPLPDLRQRAGNLGQGDRQLLCLARALAQKQCRLLILDEPTSMLNSSETARLFVVVRELAKRGIAILYVSHFLEEVARLADRYTVLRDGAYVASGEISKTTRGALVQLMAGREVTELFPRSPRTPGDTVLELSELGGQRLPLSASLSLRRGEILGIAGLLGSGRSELLRAIFGLDPVKRGTLKVKALLGPASPARRLKQGVGLLSEDRKGEGLAESLGLGDNITLSKLESLGRFGLVSPARRARVARSYLEQLGIRARGPDQLARDLSGGNQQKVCVARLLYQGVDVLLLDEPTRGVDVGSRADLYRIVDELATRGNAVLLVSSYLPELLGVCDRIAVMVRGKLGAARPASELTEHDLLLEATR
ncbi:MAG TPA: sugar ABC transporter ATP-binding protein [Polyangiaceae bacterium]|jgi:ribose transport system ATP-binding protein|nr:sugar ABC transporter ATP-binding protein [Polyangiaceae bacterium]